MSGPGGLNPGAASWTPGQPFVPISQRQQQPQQQQPGGDPTGQFGGNAFGQQPPYGYYGGQQSAPYGNQGYPYGGPGAGYNQYGGYGQQGGYYRPPQQGAYVPPQQRFQQQQQQQQQQPPPQPFQQQPAPVRDNAPAPPTQPASEPEKPAATTVRLNIGGGSAPPPTGKTISLNIGGSSTPAKTEKPAEKPAATTIKLNIGGSAASKSGTATPTRQPTDPASGTTTPKKPTEAAETTEAASGTGSVSKKAMNFTMDKAKNDADAIAEEHARVADEETLKDLYGEREKAEDANAKQHLNIVFIGHVDAGKSTMGGQLLYLCGMVDKRTMEKYEREAKEAGRESWYLSWALDSTPQERAKGKTVEVGRAYFETAARRYTILDAPGHKTYVPSMIAGAAQADVAVLVISARKGEFETGFEKGGQTREHIMLVKTAGVQKVVVVINKMDEQTVEWSKDRYNEIVTKLTPFIKGAGFDVKTAVTFIPVSAYTGVNMKDADAKSKMPWYDGPSLLGLLDNMPMVDRKTTGPVMMPVSEKYKDMGTVIVGKIESGRIRKGDGLILMPNKTMVEVAGIYNEMEEEVPYALCGDNVRVRIRGVDDEDISPGFVLTTPGKPVHAVRQFEAELAILEHKNIICAGYNAVLHVHTVSEEVQLAALLHYFDKKTGRKSKKPPQFAKRGQKIVALIETAGLICVERFKDYPQLGRFTLRDEGKTIAIGKITKLIEQSVDAAADGVAGLSLGSSAANA
ncbi:translation termination factor GTPase eRF3 [Tulasnella sp. 427]|nr:translation termination factor GTPase eRF3 [Tulasnella sp. 427]